MEAIPKTASKVMLAIILVDNTGLGWLVKGCITSVVEKRHEIMSSSMETRPIMGSMPIVLFVPGMGILESNKRA